VQSRPRGRDKAGSPAVSPSADGHGSSLPSAAEREKQRDEIGRELAFGLGERRLGGRELAFGVEHDLEALTPRLVAYTGDAGGFARLFHSAFERGDAVEGARVAGKRALGFLDRKSTRLNSSHVKISYAVFC